MRFKTFWGMFRERGFVARGGGEWEGLRRGKGGGKEVGMQHLIRAIMEQLKRKVILYV